MRHSQPTWTASPSRRRSALEGYREWLKQRLPRMSTHTAAGRDAYIFFLKNVALLPFTPEQLLAMGTQEWARSVASQTYEEHRNEGAPQLRLVQGSGGQIAHEEKDELAVRKYLEDKNILTVPAWVQHYHFAPNPAYIAAFGGIGEADYFTGPISPERERQSATSIRRRKARIFCPGNGERSARGDCA